MRSVFFLLVITAIVVYFISPTLQSEFGEMERWRDGVYLPLLLQLFSF